jgi:hypothetical protein
MWLTGASTKGTPTHKTTVTQNAGGLFELWEHGPSILDLLCRLLRHVLEWFCPARSCLISDLLMLAVDEKATSVLTHSPGCRSRAPRQVAPR